MTLLTDKPVTSRYYGRDGTIHRTDYLDVETYKGKVVAVWFRCQHLPFHQAEDNKQRADELVAAYNKQPAPGIIGLELFDIKEA
jgi:hypothetical protein